MGERWIAVGRVGRPHGLHGAFVVEVASDTPGRFDEGARVWLDRRPATVVEFKRAGRRVVIRLDREAERGSLLEVPASELPPPEDQDTFYVFDLVGLAVVEADGRVLGRVQDVAPGVANDVLELDSGLALPFVGACVLEVDLAGGRIVVAPGFADDG